VIHSCALPATAVAVVAVLAVAGCGGMPKPKAARPVSGPTASASTPPTRLPQPRPVQPSYPRLLPNALATTPTAGFVPVVTWHAHTAAWIVRTDSGVALLSFDQRLVELRLHSGTLDAGAVGWRFGPTILGAERSRLVAAFNGAFKFSIGAGGFESYGRVAIPLRAGLASIVTYADGSSDVGAWQREVPAPGRRVVSVRQNLTLLIDHGRSAATMDCLSCWGATLGGVVDPARSALGITADGRLIWAGGEHLTVSAVADALLGAHVVRAVELDINPEWVAAYLYGHRGGHGPPAPVSVLSAQQGIPGQFLAPWSRDFFSIAAR
jgi:hypothetical protein